MCKLGAYKFDDTNPLRELVETNTNKQLDDILLQYSQDRDNLIPILQEVQQRLGYLPQEAMERVASFLKLSASTVYSVSTFYSHFKLSPTGRRTVKVCRGTACHVRAGALLLREVEKQLGIKPGETSGDGEYTLETVACIGACALAPVMVTDDSVHGRVTATEADHILGSTDN
jgi:NADH:ubiquinone oxidoreductase subunit E